MEIERALEERAYALHALIEKDHGKRSQISRVMARRWLDLVEFEMGEERRRQEAEEWRRIGEE